MSDNERPQLNAADLEPLVERFMDKANLQVVSMKRARSRKGVKRVKVTFSFLDHWDASFFPDDEALQAMGIEAVEVNPLRKASRSNTDKDHA